MKLFKTILVSSLLFCGCIGASAAGENDAITQNVLHDWYKVSLLLVRHTPTYTPPVASRSLAYLGVAAYEAEASGSSDLQSLAGQLKDLKPLPKRTANLTYDDTIVMNAAMGTMVQSLFQNTGPTGQRVLSAMLAKKIPSQVNKATRMRSEKYGKALAKHILNWASTDGGAVINNMGFPASFTLTSGPGHWVPTTAIRLQQMPLLPGWGDNRTFAVPDSANCPLPQPPAYSEDKTSDYYKQAFETYTEKQNLTADHRVIARFWSDDAMLSVTPPGHWISIAWQIFDHDKIDLQKSVDVLARLGIAQADAFIGCWRSKFQFNTMRPITYIRKVFDPKWDPLLITPPFPEYPSGHSVVSGAAATVLTAAFGDHYVFDDATGSRDGLLPRHFESFQAAAEEAGISRLYGGIHFRAAIEDGLTQGRCIGKFANALRTKK